jgi:hypothetical protein
MTPMRFGTIVFPFALVTFAGAVFLPACQTPTAIVVSLETNLSCSGAQPAFAGGQLTVLRDQTPVDGSDVVIPRQQCANGTIGTMTIIPGPAGTDGTVRISAAAWLGAGVNGGTAVDARDCLSKAGTANCVVSSRSLGFIRHQSLPIPIILDYRCAGRTCPSGQTCTTGGACIDETAPPPPMDAGAIDAGPATPLVAKRLFAGGDTTCADTGSEIWCWGGAFGAPNHVAALDGASKIALGIGHYCAILKGGELRCWGSNDHRQLGVAGPATENTVTVQEVATWVDVSVGDTHSCALGQTKGSTLIVCWGDDAKGQVTGTSSKGDLLPALVTSPDIVGAKALTSLASTATSNCVNATGSAGSCVVTLGGCYDVICWGDNSLAQAARSPDSDPTPRFVRYKTSRVGLDSPIALSAGARHVLAQTTQGVFGWGDSKQGQLGLAGLTVATPTLVSPKATAAVGGNSFSCTLEGSSLQCIGEPPLKEPLPDVVAAAAGARHVCAIETKGEVVCAGANDKGQLGIANATGVVRVLR